MMKTKRSKIFFSFYSKLKAKSAFYCFVVDFSLFAIHAAVMSITDLPLILILSVYTDFVPLEFGKIQIFFHEICQNTDFLQECKWVFSMFSLVIQIFFLKYRFSLSFILIVCNTRVAGLLLLLSCHYVDRRRFLFNILHYFYAERCHDVRN